MKFITIALVLCLANFTHAQATSSRQFTFKSTIVNGSQNIKALKKSLQLQNNLQAAIYQLKYGKQKDAKKLAEAQQKLKETEAYHEKKYGLMPGLPYQMKNDKASVALLLNEDQLNKISGESTKDTQKETQQKQFKKYPQFELKSAKEIQAFMMAAQQGTLIKNKIDELKKDRKTKSIKEQKRIIEELKKAEAKKDEFDAAMNKKYGIRANLDYLVEITSVSLYLVLESTDLKEIAIKQRAKTEAAFKKKINEK